MFIFTKTVLHICYYFLLRVNHLLLGGGGGGGAVIFRGGRKLFWWCTGGVENKKPLGKLGVSYISSGIGGGGGVRCVPLVFAFIKSHSFWGALPPPPPPTPHVQTDTANNMQYSEQEAAKSKKIYKCIRHPCNKIDLLPFHCALSIIMFELQYSNIDCDQ